MKKKIKDYCKKIKHPDFIFSYHFLRLVAIAIASVIILGVIFSFSSFDKFEHGTLGDFIGGILNPCLTFITVYLLVKSLKMQREELRFTRTEITENNEIQKDNLQLQEKIQKNKQILNELKSIDKLLALSNKQLIKLFSQNDYNMPDLKSMSKNNTLKNSIVIFMKIYFIAIHNQLILYQKVKKIIKEENLFNNTPHEATLSLIYERFYILIFLIENTPEVDENKIYDEKLLLLDEPRRVEAIRSEWNNIEKKIRDNYKVMPD